MELLKQPLSHPLSMHEQVLTLCMATDGVFDKIPTRQVKQYQKDILDFSGSETSGDRKRN